MKRNSKGQFIAGQSMPEELREKISQGQIRRYQREQEELADMPSPNMKKCSGPCGQWKKVPEDFHMAERTLASGATKRYPVGECRKCNSERAARYREKLRREGKMAEKQKEWNTRRDPENRRRRSREWQRMRARMKGVPERGPWLKYRHERVELGPDTRVPSEPFMRWLEQSPFDAESVGLVSGIDPSVFRRAKPYFQLSTVDRVFTALGMADQLVVLYPPDSQNLAA